MVDHKQLNLSLSRFARTEDQSDSLILLCVQLIKAAVNCIDDIETIQEYVGYENGHQQRLPVILLFKHRAEEIRDD